jgi:hypothetical protein
MRRRSCGGDQCGGMRLRAGRSGNAVRRLSDRALGSVRKKSMRDRLIGGIDCAPSLTTSLEDRYSCLNMMCALCAFIEVRIGAAETSSTAHDPSRERSYLPSRCGG